MDAQVSFSPLLLVLHAAVSTVACFAVVLVLACHRSFVCGRLLAACCATAAPCRVEVLPLRWFVVAVLALLRWLLLPSSWSVALPLDCVAAELLRRTDCYHYRRVGVSPSLSIALQLNCCDALCKVHPHVDGPLPTRSCQGVTVTCTCRRRPLEIRFHVHRRGADSCTQISIRAYVRG